MNTVLFPKLRALQVLLSLALLSAGSFAHVQAADTGTWVPSWTASPQPVWNSDFVLPLGLPATLQDQTVRQTLRASVGGSRVRIVLSNEYGAQALKVGAAHIAPAGGTGKALTFGGQQAITVPANAVVMSDPVEMPVAALSRLSVSLYFPQTTPLTTIHWDGLQPAQIAAGNTVNADALKADTVVNSRLFLSAVLVDAASATRTVVAFGDSITDGAAS